ncbi:MAG: 50S ribosomal protein L29 [Bacteroidota bacterium]|nr:50S ribosomal protein L29 [Bacteroidota bacterium]
MSNRKDFNKSLREMSVTDLKAKIEEDELRIKKLKFAHAVSPLENPMNIRAVRRDLARVKTELKAKQMGTKS